MSNSMDDKADFSPPLIKKEAVNTAKAYLNGSSWTIQERYFLKK